MKLSIADLFQLRRGLDVVDHGRACTVDGKTTARDWFLPFATRLQISAVETMIAPHLKTAQKEMERLRRSMATQKHTSKEGEEALVIPLDQQGAYADALDRIMDASVEIDLPEFAADAWNDGEWKDSKNPWPVQALTDLRLLRLLRLSPKPKPAPTTDPAADEVASET